MATTIERFAARAAVAAACCIPLALGILAGSPEPYWLDSPEFTAAAQTLGIPHPPGHPLYVMLAKPFTLLPLGTIAFRVALASAVFGALASLLLYLIAERLLAASARGLPLLARVGIALAATLTVAVAPGWWFQAVRAEVYSLQILLVLGAFYPLLCACLRREDEGGPDRLLYAAAFLFGLGLANHHFIMLAALPAAVPLLVALARTRGGPGALLTTARLAGVSACGLLPYALLPIRSAAGAPLSLGAVHSAGDFWWVVSAKAYQKSMLREHGADLADRSINALYTMMGELGPLVVVAALAGFYLLLRRRPTRLSGIVIALLGGVTILLRAIMGFDPYNPDYLGYMLPAVTALALGAAVFAAVAINVLGRELKGGRWIGAALVLALLALPVLRGRTARPEVDLSDFRSTRLFLDLAYRDLAPGTVVLTSYYKLFFVLWSAPYIDGSRPDVIVVNPHLFGYPGYLNTTLGAHPWLRQLAWSMVVSGRVTETALADLSLKHPLKVEPSPWLDDKAARYLLPGGPLYDATPEPLSLSDVRAAAPAHFERWRRLYADLGPAWKEHETWRMLTWSHYLDALFLARRGAREEAAAAIDLARELGAEAPQLRGLGEELARPGRGPVDIAPFLPEALPATMGQARSGDPTD